MIDHPFDEIAVEAAAQAACESQGRDWSKLPEHGKEWWRVQTLAALSAAFKSARERGMAETGYGYVINYDGNFYEWKASSSEPSDKTGRFPVTIIRHKGE
jgi:hypothetical protein